MSNGSNILVTREIRVTLLGQLLSPQGRLLRGLNELEVVGACQLKPNGNIPPAAQAVYPMFGEMTSSPKQATGRG